MFTPVTSNLNHLTLTFKFGQNKEMITSINKTGVREVIGVPRSVNC